MSTAAYYIPSDYKHSNHTSSAPASASIAGSRQTATRMNRTKANVRLAAIAAVILLCIGFGAMVHAFAGEGEVQAAGIPNREQIIVKPGDTLWSISEPRVQKGEDIRVYIQKLKKANGITSSSLQAGQVLVLP